MFATRRAVLIFDMLFVESCSFLLLSVFVACVAVNVSMFISPLMLILRYRRCCLGVIAEACLFQVFLKELFQLVERDRVLSTSIVQIGVDGIWNDQ